MAYDMTPELFSNFSDKNMVLLPFTINPWAQFRPILQSYLSTSHHPPQNDWCPDRPYATLMYKRASTPPCFLGILTYADIQWSNSKSASRRKFFGNSYTAPTPSLHTIQLMGLGPPKPLAHFYAQQPIHFHSPYTQHSTSTHSSLWKIHTTHAGSLN
jgi:hypothetical protein